MNGDDQMMKLLAKMTGTIKSLTDWVDKLQKQVNTLERRLESSVSPEDRDFWNRVEGRPPDNEIL